MRSGLFAGILVMSVAATTVAQQPDSVAKRDSIQKAQSDSAMRADSILLERELGRIRNEPRRREGLDQVVTGTATPATGQGPTNPTLLPNISGIGDLVFDLSPDGSTQETGERFYVREVELGIQAAVDPYFRGDFFLGVHGEAIEIEEAYLSTLALPWQTQVRLGRFLLPFGKQNTTHRPELHTVEHSRAVQEFLGAEGGKGTGMWFSKIFAPFGFYQEVQGAVVDAFAVEEHGHGEEGHDEGGELVASEPANKRLSGLGYAARLRNYRDLSEATNVEVSGSLVTGKRAVGVICESGGLVLPTCPNDVTAVNTRQSVVGADVTYRWRPLQQGLYRSLIVQAEWMRQINPHPDLADIAGVDAVTLEGSRNSFNAAYLFARYQLTRRTYAAARFDWLEEPEEPGESLTAASAYLIFYPSEFSKMVAMYERVKAPFEKATNRLVFQTTFAVGPHRPHPF